MRRDASAAAHAKPTVVVVTGRRNTYQGVIRIETLMGAMAGLQSAARSAESLP